jgi:hypothetical protein
MVGKVVDLHGLWLVLLDSAKDLFLGVDPSGQHVPPSSWYGTTYLLIKNILGSVSDLVEQRYREYLL